MKTFNLKTKYKKTILALGAESAGNFSVFHNGKIYFSKDFGDLMDNKNYKKFQKAVLDFLKKNKLKPDIILTDLHPEYRTTLFGKKLSKKFLSASGGKAKHIKVQHHHAHVFSAIGENIILNKYPKLPVTSYQLRNAIGVALDGTGYGTDGNIWGGEIFQISPLIKGVGGIKRIGHLENQIMLGGDLAVKEPARMLISILSKFLNKDNVYKYVKKYYTKNQFELLYNQLEQDFNCQKTSSTGRILDAVSLLLGFSKNERKFKHAPIKALEKNSSKPYTDLKPIVKNNILLTTPLFKYLIKNLNKDKKRLAATAQLYIAQGLCKIAGKNKIYLAGGIANNKIISSYLESKGAITNKKFPRGDAGISFGQIIKYLYFK